MSSTKPISHETADNTLRYAFNDADRTLAVGSFVTGQVGNNIQRAIVNSTTDNYSYYDASGTLLYTLQVVYDDSNRDNVNSVTRIA